MRRLGLGLVLAAALVAAGPVAAQDRDEAAPPPRIAVEADGASDAAIARRIRSLYAEIDALSGLRVTVDAGVVTLEGEVIDAEARDSAQALAERVADVAAVENAVTLDTDVARRLAPVWQRTVDRLWNLVGLLPLLAVATVVFALIGAIGLWTARRAWWARLAPNAFIADLVRQSVRLAFLALGLVLALDVLGATALLGTVLGAAGLVGLALGFAVRDTVENYIASILLSLRQPFRPNDLVLIEGVEGHVTAMTSRATVLTTLESNRVRIPNATVFKSVIVNYTREPERRFDFRVGVETDDLRRAVDMGLETIRALDFILDDPAPLGFIEEVGDSAIILFFGAWVDQTKTSYPKARGEAIRRVMLAFEAASIGVPEPIYRLRFDGAGGGIDAVLRESDGETAAPEPSPSRASAALAREPADVARETESVIETKVARERADAFDLLDPHAPREDEAG